MRIYLASRYSRRLELCKYRDELQEVGHTVTSRWLDGNHQIDNVGVPIGNDGERLVESGATAEADALRRHFVQEDVADVIAARCVISFTEEPRTTKTRGGRHVEFGIALGLLRAAQDLGTNLVEGPNRLIVVGHLENLFHFLPEVEFCETWEAAKTLLQTTPNVLVNAR